MYCGMCCTCRCWFSNLTYFYTSLIAPLCIMLLFNLVTVFIVTRSLHSKLSVSPDYSNVKLVRIIASLSLLVGATWSIGALLSFVDSIGLQYAFAILNSLQGFLIFFVNILTSNDIRARIQTSMKSSVLPIGSATAVTTTTSLSDTARKRNSTATSTSRIDLSESRDRANTTKKMFLTFFRSFSRTRKYSPNDASNLKRNQSSQNIIVSHRSTTFDDDDWDTPSSSHNTSRKPWPESLATTFSPILISTAEGCQFQSFEDVEMTGIRQQYLRDGEEHISNSVHPQVEI